jgi:hypothetical protein
MFSDSRLQRLAPVVAALAALLVLASCSGPEVSGDATDIGGSAADFAALTTQEKQVLKDKKVSTAEYAQTTQVYKECLTAAGITFDDPQDGELGPGAIGTKYTAPQGATDAQAVIDRMSAQQDACRSSVAAVEDVWVLQHQVSESELDAAKSSYVVCVSKVGIGVTSSQSIEEAGAAARKFLEANVQVTEGTTAARKVSQLLDCAGSLSGAVVSAKPGVQQILDRLDTSAW